MSWPSFASRLRSICAWRSVIFWSLATSSAAGPATFDREPALVARLECDDLEAILIDE